MDELSRETRIVDQALSLVDAHYEFLIAVDADDVLEETAETAWTRVMNEVDKMIVLCRELG